MQAVDEKRVDQIVVYKIDRMTRSLADFAKLVDRLDAVEASFVSVTQSFNTATSMGRLTLNVLLSFAQFEREVTAERIRDKIAVSKRKGLWMGGNAPLGYLPGGRSLKIDAGEATTIKTLYDLYREHGTIRAVKEHADQLGLRSRRRERAGGRISGGGPLDRGHIHHILSNPIYAGRIRHKKQVFDGQHAAIIEPAVWDQIQRLLEEGATKTRGTKQTGLRSPLAGKLYDETGDRLTPSHSRKNGKRLRYYISRRLVTDRSTRHPDAWRLPAAEIERLVANLVQRHLGRSGAAALMVTNASAVKIVTVQTSLAKLASPSQLIALIERVDLKPGSLKIKLDAKALAEALDISSDRLTQDELTIEAPFQRRRRGVELKLHLGEPAPEIDRTLVLNIVKAQRWLKMIIAGRTFAEIASAEDISKRRVQDVIDLALLAPDVLAAIASGAQSDGLNSDYLIKTGFDPIWVEQRSQFANL